MDLNEIAALRLVNQGIRNPGSESVRSVVSRMGAIQAQDYAMAKWAIGLRLPGSTDDQVEAAIAAGEIIRTHLLRPTWHFVAADDLRWLLELTAPRIKAGMRSRNMQLGLSESIIIKSHGIIGKVLKNGNHLTRAELLGHLEKAKLRLDENRASHLLFEAELDGLICSGASKNGKPTYALLDERVPPTQSMNGDDARSVLAHRYFTSRAPATLQDFSWWSGLTTGAARQAMESIRPDFVSQNHVGQTYWLPKTSSAIKVDHREIFLLPAFDELIISYSDRSAILGLDELTRMVISGGVFRPLILLNGQGIGVWKRTVKGERVRIESELLGQIDKSDMAQLEEAFINFGRFLNKQVEITPPKII